MTSTKKTSDNKMSNPDIFTVLVECMTYNQREYIEDSMDGFCMQKTNFPYICVIMDDCSTDGEQEIIRRYVAKHFFLITEKETDDYILNQCQHKTNTNCYFAVFYLKYNHYSIKKDKNQYYLKWREKCKYIAFCEGDDYWIDEEKLQIQTNFLERNDEYGMCYTKAKCFVQALDAFQTKTIGDCFDDFEDLLKNTNRIPTLTTCIRRFLLKKYEEEIKPQNFNWLMGDYPMWLFFAHESKVHFIDKIFCVYRILDNSASHSTDVDKIIKFNESVYDIKRFYANKYNVDYNFIEDYNLTVFRIYFGILMKEYNREYADKLRMYGALQKTNKKYKLYCLFSYNGLLWVVLKLILSIKNIVKKGN